MKYEGMKIDAKSNEVVKISHRMVIDNFNWINRNVRRSGFVDCSFLRSLFVQVDWCRHEGKTWLMIFFSFDISSAGLFKRKTNLSKHTSECFFLQSIYFPLSSSSSQVRHGEDLDELELCLLCRQSNSCIASSDSNISLLSAVNWKEKDARLMHRV